MCLILAVGRIKMGGLEVGDNLVAIIEVQGSKRANHELGGA